MTCKCFIYAITLKSKKQIPLSLCLNYNHTSLCVLGCTSVDGSMVYMCVCVCSLCLTWCSDQVQCCFTAVETMRSVRDGEPRMAILTFTPLLSSDYVHRDHKDYEGQGAQEEELVADVILWCVCVCVQGRSCGFQVHCWPFHALHAGRHTISQWWAAFSHFTNICCNFGEAIGYGVHGGGGVGGRDKLWYTFCVGCWGE